MGCWHPVFITYPDWGALSCPVKPFSQPLSLITEPRSTEVQEKVSGGYAGLISVDKFPMIELRRVVLVRFEFVRINKVFYRGCSVLKHVVGTLLIFFIYPYNFSFTLYSQYDRIGNTMRNHSRKK